MIRLHQLKKFYNGKSVLDIESCEFPSGHIHIVVGRNGSGKTTLLKLVNRILSPDEGHVENPYQRLEMVLCHQKPYMFRASVLQNIHFGLRYRRHMEVGENGHLVERLGLAPLLKRDAATLSAGETQRVAIARAMILNPRLLLLDEPVANLDPESIERIENELIQFRARGNTAIMVTHRIEQALHLSSHVMRLDGGRISTPETQNLFEGNIEKRGDQFFLAIENQVGICVGSHPEGRARVAIPATDIVLSKTALQSSMRNCFTARVVSLAEIGDMIRVKVDAGIPLDVVVTHSSMAELNITIGTEIFASFKASAVKIF